MELERQSDQNVSSLAFLLDDDKENKAEIVNEPILQASLPVKRKQSLLDIK